MSEYPEIAERFQRETASHEMQVLHDDGLYRHLRFLKPGHSSYWFDLITAPGSLIFQGDGDSYVFRRLTDMFEFFRSGIWEDGSLHINPHYWAEKLTSDRDSVMKYDQDSFERQVKEYVAEAIVDRSAPRGISQAVRDLLENGDITWEGGARRALEDFEYRTHTVTCTCGASATFDDPIDASSWGYRHLRESEGKHSTTTQFGDSFSFDDTWEWEFKDYDWWFLWACHGILWGIQQYDAAKAAKPAEQAGVAS
ncbi:hypothetical protein ACIBQX_11775 [Nonomuraea sp. NPDC049714]|uniref:hypothetical protein n=1 Tax=Nonomuraea sp. NPDC049714 TaxID=3364357 RepID=UPI0037AA08C4